MRNRPQLIKELIEATDYKDSGIALNSGYIRDLFNDTVGHLKDATKIAADNKRQRAHIKQLKADKAKLLEKIEQLEAERDAAVRDLTEMAQDTDESCEYCKMFKTPHCSRECRMKNKGFEWRGI